jgi:hypothetical protein
MRKSTLMVMLILVGAFAVLMYLANSSLGMYRPDIEAAQQLTSRSEERGDLADGSRVKLRRVDGSGARKGPGLNVEAKPSPDLLRRDGGLTALARALVVDALSAYPADVAESLRWFKLTFELPEGATQVVHLDRPPDGSLLGPTPPLPRTWPPTGAPPTPAGARPPPGPGHPEAPGPGPGR